MRNKDNFTTLEWLIVVTTAIGITVGIIALVAAAGALIICWAWNNFMPSVFGLPSITFIQAFALTFLIGSLKGLLGITINRKKEE